MNATSNQNSTAPETAEVILTIKRFRNVLKTSEKRRDTPCEMSMAKEHGRVFVERTATTSKLRVKKGAGPITFSFKVVDGESSEVYHPLGIAFKTQPVSSVKRNRNAIGESNFPTNRIHIYEKSIYVTDLAIPQSKGVKYKFSVIYQRELDGEMGIIDPGVENDN